MDTSNGKEEPTKQEDVVGRNEMKEEGAGSRNSSTDRVNFESGPEYQICIPLG
jgi:hypothetical protein